jgi:hypothetical protein
MESRATEGWTQPVRSSSIRSRADSRRDGSRNVAHKATCTQYHIRNSPAEAVITVG